VFFLRYKEALYPHDITRQRTMKSGHGLFPSFFFPPGSPYFFPWQDTLSLAPFFARNPSLVAQGSWRFPSFLCAGTCKIYLPSPSLGKLNCPSLRELFPFLAPPEATEIHQRVHPARRNCSTIPCLFFFPSRLLGR